MSRGGSVRTDMSIKRAVFLANKAAETVHLGSIGFVRAVKHVRPDLLLDTRARRKIMTMTGMSSS